MSERLELKKEAIFRSEAPDFMVEFLEANPDVYKRFYDYINEDGYIDSQALSELEDEKEAMDRLLEPWISIRGE